MEIIHDQYPINVMARGVLSLIARLTPQQRLALIGDGQTRTWPQVERIRICTAVSR